MDTVKLPPWVQDPWLDGSDADGGALHVGTHGDEGGEVGAVLLVVLHDVAEHALDGVGVGAVRGDVGDVGPQVLGDEDVAVGNVLGGWERGREGRRWVRRKQ